MKRFLTYSKSLPAFVCAASLCLCACNEKEDEAVDTYTPTESVAVSKFSLQANNTVMANLDSVYFSIDLNNGVIFNADSLPLGTDVKSLVANISFPSSVTTATVEMTGGKHRTGSFDYKANSSDTIDFTGKVTLTLATENNIKKTYRLKVNVHKSKPDSIVWDKTGYAPLPAVSASPKDQKTVRADDRIMSLIRENDGSLTLASTNDISSARWTTTAVNPGFLPQVRSLTVCDGKFYILSDTGELYTSDDAVTWTSLARHWSSIIGEYGNRLLGIALDNGVFTHVSYPDAPDSGNALEDGFPVTGYSNFAPARGGGGGV